MEHHFNVSIAQKIGVNEAIFLNNIAFWTQKNIANGKHIHDGLCWTYNTIKAFCELFPYWTRHQLEHLIKKCTERGWLQEGNYNNNTYDRTKWYALTKQSWELFPEIFTEKNITKINRSANFGGVDISKSTISENSEMDLGKFRNGSRKTPKPIPDSKTHIENTTTTTASSSSDTFLSFKRTDDHRSDAEFIAQCEFHIANRKPEYTEQQAIKGLIKILKNGIFETPAGYKPKQQLDRREKERAYQEYKNRISADINLGLISNDTEILEFPEWLTQNSPKP
jgi:hypothetical protein